MNPNHANPQPGTGPQAPAAPLEDKPRLLIVDDVFENREILRRRFERQGYHVTEASGGIEALDTLERAAFDLVLLDMMMPDLSGLEVLAHIRARHSAGSLPVIMVTAKTQSEDIVEALKRGANDYITKPVDFSIALARVVTQIERRRAEVKIHQMNEELARTNEALERRVADRTKDLVQVNQQLRNEIEQRERTQATITHLAHHDALTGLGNRLLFHKELGDALSLRQRHGGDLAVLFIDLDGFKAINDTLGHATGDMLLKHLAARLRNTLRESDKIGRLGGDEFAIIQFRVGQPTEAVALAERLIQTVQAPFDIDGQRLVVGASIGIALAGGDYQDSAQLLRAADLAMYRAKTEGRGRFQVFESDFDRQAKERRELEVALRAAVEQDALEIHYQPLVNLQTGRISGFEALSRWHDPQRGQVPPNVFIALAEEVGLIGIIGERILQRACAEAANWPPDTTVAVNLSAAQFQSGDLVAVVKNALATSGLAPERLEVEITESIFLQGSESNLEILSRLGALGVKISMDDFGTGYSSLSYLRSFPFHKIKIDRSFIGDLPEGQSSVAIVRAVCGLARSFGASTTAEGVETDGQLTSIRAEGCTEVQGYIFSKPVPADQIPALLALPPRPSE
ncbi:MAG: EAL domain-containing protein [Acidovorax sp.]|uniref:putative bifunctional diguanylate cyclase/phosphodiesterase n=1 Tax=Acidovorax sp. TaxID=1872122 RepID=UPI0039E60A9E